MELSKLNKRNLLNKTLQVHSDKKWLDDKIYKDYLLAKEDHVDGAETNLEKDKKGKCIVS